MALPCCNRGSHFCFWASEPNAKIGIHHERRLHGNEAAQRRIAALDFLHHQPVLHVRHTGAAVTFECGSKESQLRHLRNELRGKFSFAIVLLDYREDLIVDKLASGLARQLFFVI